MSPTSQKPADLAEEAPTVGIPTEEPGKPGKPAGRAVPPEPGAAPEPGSAPAPGPGPGPEPESASGPVPTSGPISTAAPAAEQESVSGGRKGSAAWRRRVAWAVAGAVVAGAVAFGAVQWISAERLADRLAAERSERLAVSTRAGEFAVALQTYDHTDLQAYRDRVFGLSGEDFEKTYDEAFSPLESVISAMRASSTASVRGVYVSEVADGRARAITVVDSQVKSTAGTRRMLGAHMELGLVKIGGQWRVNDATVMGAADELVTDPDGKAVEPGPSPSPTGKDR